MAAETPFLLLLGDIRLSTRLSRRAATAALQALETVAERFNAELQPPPHIPIAVNYGDEIAGVFTQAASAYAVMAAARDALWPHAELRFVLAEGLIGAETQDVTKIGGPVFKRAADAMTKTKSEGRFCRFDIDAPLTAATLDALVEAANALIEDLTPYRRDILALRRKGARQVDIVEVLGKKPQSVSKAIAEGKIELIIDIEAAITAQLAAFDQRRRGAENQ